jgi:hypothetical protein
MSKVREPWHPAEWTPEDAGAIQACLRGDALPHQQQRAMKWVIEGASMTYDASFYPSNARITDYIEGKRSVGNQIVKLAKLHLPAFTNKDGKETA